MKIKGETIERTIKLDRKRANEENFTVPASLSSEKPVERFFGTEVLLHTSDAINMERAGTKRGLPLLLDHDDAQLVGRVRNIKLGQDNKLRGDLEFSQNTQRGREAWAEVRDGFLTDISIRYSIDQIRETSRDGQPDLIEVTRWTPLEASAVAVPADSDVGVFRSKPIEGATMSDKKTQTQSDGDKDQSTVADFNAARDKATQQGKADGIKAERKRVSDINMAFSFHTGRDGVLELRDKCIDDGLTAEQAGRALIEFLSTGIEPTHQQTQQGQSQHGRGVEIVKDEKENWSQGIERALELRTGLIKDKEEARKERAENPFVGMSLLEMARSYLERNQVDVRGMDRRTIAGQSFVRAGMHSTSDFSAILENIATKQLAVAYEEAPETWRAWCRVGNLADFKAGSRVNMSSFSDLPVVEEGAEYTEGSYSDKKEEIQLDTYGRTFTITRQAIINDDASAFERIPAGMGRAAARMVGNLAYAVLTGNPTMLEDGTNLFDPSHNNEGTPAAISETSLDLARTAMATQRSPAPRPGEEGAVLNITPAYLIVPHAQYMVATKTVRSSTAPDQVGDLVPNTFFNQLQVIVDARLDVDSTTRWYLTAPVSDIDTVEVAFLDGNESPMLEQMTGFTQDGVTYKVRHDAAAAPIDWRGMYANAGA